MPFSDKESEGSANEVLTEKPTLFENNGKLNLNYINQLSDYFNDRYGLRNHMINLDHRIIGTVFNESAENKVILGKDGWLFYTETLDDYEGTNILSEREIYSAARSLFLADEYYEKKEIDFSFTIVPNKNSLYPDKMPSYYPKSSQKSNMELLGDELKNIGVNYIDLYNAFKNEDKILYRTTDSHWTYEGAGYASDTIMKSLKKDYKPYYKSETKEEKAPAGDLFEMLYPTSEDNDKEISYTRPFRYTYERPIRSVEDNFIRTLSDSENGNLFMFRDSFGNSLHHFLAGEFSKSVFCRLMPYNLTLAESEKADTVLIEIVERNIDWLLTKGLIFPSPERNSESYDYEDITSDTVYDISETDELPGYIKIEGNIKTLPSDSNIYVMVNQKIYEAVPKINNGFSLYIPNSEKADNISVLIK